MALTIINSPGLATSNAYVSLATCSLMLEMDINRFSTWSSLSTVSKTSCIIFATAILDSSIDWIGTRGNSTQALRWPRAYVVDSDGYDVTSTDIPTKIQLGTSYFSYFLSQSDRVADPTNFGFKSLKAGSLEMVVDKYDRRPVMPNFIFDLLRPYGTRSSSINRVLVRK